MRNGFPILSAAAALAIASCTDDPRPSASREQIAAGLVACGIVGAKVEKGIEGATTDLLVDFASETDQASRDCFDQQMERFNVLQTTAWSGAPDADAR